MKTQDTNTLREQTSSPPPALHHRNPRRFAGIGAVIAIALIVGLSAIVFAQLAQHRSGKQPPNAGQWKQVLNGYTVVSLVAAPNNPSVLYACAIQSQNTPTSNSGQSASYTVLRSTDFGSHWQNIGSSAALGGNCELAISPDNSNNVYVVGLTTTKPAHDVLKHSTDGGQTWTTIEPTLHLDGTQPTMLWNVQQISIEGNRMFGLQWMPIGALPANRDIEPADVLSERLATSSDGGQTWTVIDGQFIAQRLSARSYAADPSNPNIIYDLLGGSLLPVARPVPTNDVVPGFSLNGELYKTTDGGATWHLLRKDLTFGTQVQLASNKPEIIYVGGLTGAYPLTAQPSSADGSSQAAIYPRYVGFFHLSMSGNGGATWRDITIPANSWAIRSWVVSPDGQVYLSPAITFNGTTGNGAAGGQTTAIASTAVVVGTVVPGKKGLVPPTVPQSGTSAPSTNTNQVPTPNVPPPATVIVPTVPPQSQTIQRYDPTTDKWSQVTNPPASGILLTVTPTGTNGSAILWFLGLDNGNEILYRYATG